MGRCSMNQKCWTKPTERGEGSTERMVETESHSIKQKPVAGACVPLRITFHVGRPPACVLAGCGYDGTAWSVQGQKTQGNPIQLLDFPRSRYFLSPSATGLSAACSCAPSPCMPDLQQSTRSLPSSAITRQRVRFSPTQSV